MTKHSIQEISADLKVRFGGASTTAKRKAVQQLPVINSLTSTPSNRDVRVHDLYYIKEGLSVCQQPICVHPLICLID